MGKSGNKKKKSGATVNQNQVPNSTIPNGNGGIELDPSIFLKRAHELKEEGNTRFQNKDYAGALEQYDKALKLTPKTHPDRAVFHSNRAACLMQMKPIDYESVVAECSMALLVQPGFPRALLRRAKAYEAIGKYEMAVQDVQAILGADPNHKDALEITRRIKAAVGLRQEAQDLQSRPSPAALGASAVRGAPVSGLGPCLPARPAPKKAAAPATGSGLLANNKPDKPQALQPTGNGSEVKTGLPKIALKPSNGSPKSSSSKDKAYAPSNGQELVAAIRWRQLKLVYDHDIRLSKMPANSNFKELREIVAKRFPSSKFVLIKYKDNDGDLVTITSTAELRLAESYVDNLIPKEPDTDSTDSIGMLRLHVVEVSPEQEPPILEEEEEKVVESDENKVDDSGSHSSAGDLAVVSAEIDTSKPETGKEKPEALEDPDCKEVEMDDWLFEFAQLFRTHVGIDPDAHIDLHELGMELSSEALEETVTSEEAQALFEKASLKFQEVAALAFFNWGNVHMCAARKKIPIDDSAGKDMMASQLQTAYDWVREKYTLAKEKYEQALLIKPDFYEGLLALGQQQFEMAKLHWSYVIAKKEDLSKWDPEETISLFDSAEEKMKVATEMWEKLEEQRANELKDPTFVNKREELLKRKKKQGNEGESSGIGVQGEVSADEAVEQAAAMRSQIHLFWGNMLFERSQVECKLGLDGWSEKLDAAVERFKLAGASEVDISTVLKNHCSKLDSTVDEKKVEDSSADVQEKADDKAEEKPSTE